MSISYIEGPIISCASIDAHRDLFEKVFGLEPVAESVFNEYEINALFGLSGYTARNLVLATPGTNARVRLIQFNPVSDIVIRDRASGHDCDALKVIDFYTPNYSAAQSHLEANGFSLKDEVATYDMPEGHFIEAHLWGPDEVVTALISGPPSFFANFAKVTDRLFSEIQSMSTPVADFEGPVRFYNDVLSLDVIYKYGIDDDSFANLVGTGGSMALRARNIGTSTQEPYLGLIHYGLDPKRYTSLRSKSAVPHRGLVGATLIARDISRIEQAAKRERAEILAPLCNTSLVPFGRAASLSIRAPHGIIHHIVEPL